MYGIIGYPLQTTFSPDFFKQKFAAIGINDTYEKFPLKRIQLFEDFIKNYPEVKGLNVTIPYKKDIIPYLDALDETAKEIGAVNCIQFKDGKLTGFNTDAIGFLNSLKPLLKSHHNKALILGNGGATKAVEYVLKQLHISYHIVSRDKDKGQFTYEELNETIIQEHSLIINTTPLGMQPNDNLYPPIPYECLSAKHLLYDLVYFETPFLQKGKQAGAATKDGYDMLIGQAEASWEIWNR